MSKKQNKVIHYRRVNFENEDAKKYEYYVKQVFDILESTGEAKINIYERTFERMAYEYTKGVGCFVHFATYIEGDKACGVPKKRRSTKAELQALSAPDNIEFSDGDLHVLISGNNVYYCPIGVHDGNIKRYFDALFDREEIDIPEYSLRRATTQQALKALAEGVRKIGINSTADKAVLQYETEKASGNTLAGSMGKAICAFARNDDRMSKALKRHDISICISIGTKGRVVEDDTRVDLLNRIGEGIIEEDEEEQFYIITSKGTRITSKDISIKKRVRMNKFAKSVFRDEAWSFLRLFRKDMVENGLEE